MHPNFVKQLAYIIRQLIKLIINSVNSHTLQIVLCANLTAICLWSLSFLPAKS